MFGRRPKLKYEIIEKDDITIKDFDLPSRSIFTNSCIWSAFFTSFLIGIYYVPSICLIFYQRWLYQDFHFPLFTVLIHMIFKFLLALIIKFIIRYKTGRPGVVLGWKDYIFAVGPVGTSGGLDIGLSNWGLALVQISLYTMTKSTTVVFILAFSIFFKLEKKSWSLCLIVTMIAVGLILFTYKATQFNLLGFILLLLASIISGVRWTCVQLILQKSKIGMKSPVDMIYLMQPWMIISVLPFAICIEGRSLLKFLNLLNSTENEFSFIIFKVLLSAFIAFFMEFSEIMVVAYTSSLTLSIAGIFKEVFVIILAVEWSGDQMTLIKFVGLLLCLAGTTFHVIHKLKNNGRPFNKEDELPELSQNLILDETLDIDSDSDCNRNDSQTLFNILKIKNER